MKLAWLTDTHLNFLEKDKLTQFYDSIIKSHCDAIVISGDIAEGPSICEFLSEMSEKFERRIYFVLGNHDYYFSSVDIIRPLIKTLCEENKNLIWLGDSKIIKLNNETVILGGDGWADARYGDYNRSRVQLNDSRCIQELHQASLLNRQELQKTMQILADHDAKQLQINLKNAAKHKPKNIIIVTHIPPFSEACRHDGKPSDEEWVPFFSSKASGDVIMACATRNPDIHYLVLCGHTHEAHEINPMKNLRVRVGGNEYYYPEIQDIIDVTLL